MLAGILIILELAALLLAIYTMININTVCNDYLKRHKDDDHKDN